MIQIIKCFFGFHNFIIHRKKSGTWTQCTSICPSCSKIKTWGEYND